MADEFTTIALIGFGEAASAFVEGAALPRHVFAAFDVKTDCEETRLQKIAEYQRAGVTPAMTAEAALHGATMALSLVTADQALVAAQTGARYIETHALYCDLNSVAPQTKAAAAAAIEQGGGRYVDVAVMSPVRPGLTATPLLVSGPHAEAATAALKAIGFSDVESLDGPVGAASAIKMIRSVMIKGMEALTAECFLAAEAAGVRDQVIASLDASSPQAGWAKRADYNLDRMLVHGARRAAEMDEVIKTLCQLGCDAAMSRATAMWQRRLGATRRGSPSGLKTKLDLIRAGEAEPA